MKLLSNKHRFESANKKESCQFPLDHKARNMVSCWNSARLNANEIEPKNGICKDLYHQKWTNVMFKRNNILMQQWKGTDEMKKMLQIEWRVLMIMKITDNSGAYALYDKSVGGIKRLISSSVFASFSVGGAIFGMALVRQVSEPMATRAVSRRVLRAVVFE